MFSKTIKAKFSQGVIKPLEKLDIQDGTEISVTIVKTTDLSEEERLKRAKSAAGAWKDIPETEELKQIIYESRRTGSRIEPDL